MSNSVKPVPEGYHTVTPYLVVNRAEEVIEFMQKAFGAKELSRMLKPDGSVGHCEYQIGDSKVMLGGASEEWKAMPIMLYLYLPDVDAVYQRAVAAGGKSLKAPEDQFYGDRTAAVVDMSGNQWWIATHTRDVSGEEMEQKYAEAKSKQS